MARQVGARSQLLVKKEAAYGVAPGGNWQKFPVRSYDVVTANDIIEDPAIGFGHRETIDPSQGPIQVKGPLSVPLDLRSIGFWLSMLLGSETVTGTGPFTHIFQPEEVGNLNSFSAELGHADVGSYFLHTGVLINKGTFTLQGTGLAALALDAIAQNETRNNASVGGAATAFAYTPFSQLQGTLFEDATGSLAPANAIANVTSATLVIDNQVNAEVGVGSGGKVLGGDAGQFKVSGELTMRFADSTHYDLAVAKTYKSLSMGYKIDANNLINLSLPRIVLGRFTPPLSGPAGIIAKVPYQASRDATAQTTLVATLINDVAAY